MYIKHREAFKYQESLKKILIMLLYYTNILIPPYLQHLF